MSTDNKLILTYLLSMLIHFMLVSFLILFAKVLNAIINKYADRGQPCLTLL